MYLALTLILPILCLWLPPDVASDGWVNPDPGKNTIRKVVIDAGHGGKDPGCLGAGSKEKEITLGIALLLQKKINKAFPEVKVILTRDKDEFIPLHERSQIANKSKADLFISLHCNAVESGNHVKGSETYVLGLHRAEANLAVARRENEAILLEDNYKLNYGDFDPNSPEAYILMAMYQNAYLEQSIVFADFVEQAIHGHAKRHSKGVKQAGFLVLRETAMPSVLVEAGFLSNVDDEKFLRTTNGQELVAESLLKAFSRYKRHIEGESLNQTIDSLAVREKQEGKVVAGTDPAKSPSIPSGLWFGVQIGALKTPMAIDHPYRTKVSQLIEKQESGFYKYFAGPYSSALEAEKIKGNLVQSGFKGTFVVAFNGVNRIDQGVKK